MAREPNALSATGSLGMQSIRSEHAILDQGGTQPVGQRRDRMAIGELRAMGQHQAGLLLVP